MNLHLFHACLAAVIFVLVLGLFLPGARRVQVGVVAGIAWLGLLAAIWNRWGMESGIVALALSPLYAAVSLPLAGPAARSWFGPVPEDEGTGPPPPPPMLVRISQALAVGGPDSEAAEVLLDWCMADPGVGASREALAELLNWLWDAGANRWVGEHHLAASALAHPPARKRLLDAEPDTREQALARVAAHLEYGAPV